MSQFPPTRRAFLRQTALAGGCCLLSGRAFVKSAHGRRSGPNRADGPRRHREPRPQRTPDRLAGQGDHRVETAIEQPDPKPTPRSWTFQAAIHGSQDANPNPAWNQCQHGNWWFFPWHRAYLYYFERILRDAAGDSTLTLPYWNWNAADERSIPSPFLDPNSTLYDPTRQMNDGSSLPSQTVVDNLNLALSQLTFVPSQFSALGFGGQPVSAPGSYDQHGQLESSPHDNVHVLVGGNMSDPTTAALDPIFWLHHCNIDRIWTQWLSSGNGRANPTDSSWINQSFGLFDEQKNPVTITVAQVLDSVQSLNYRYDDQIAPAPSVARAFVAGAPPMSPQGAATEKVVATAEPTEKTLGAKPVTVSVKLPDESKPLIGKAFQPLGAVPAVPSLIRLKIEGVEFDKNPGVVYQVYLNLPKGGPTPETDALHYVGNLTFFAKKHDHGAPGNHKEPANHAAGALPGFSQTFDVTRVVRGLQKLGLWNEKELSVTLIPLGPVPKAGHVGVAPAPPPAPKGAVTFRRISLSVGS